MPVAEKSHEYNELIKFINSSDEEFEELISLINEKPPRKSIKRFMESFDDKKTIIDILYYFVLLNKIDTISTISTTEIVSFLQAKVLKKGEELTSSEIDLLEAKKGKILAIKNLKIIASANSLLYDGKEIINHKITTSVKPIFYDNVNPFEICGSVVSNEMKIAFREHGDLNEMSFDISIEKLEAMKKVIDRALEKNKVLIENLDSNDKLKTIK